MYTGISRSFTLGFLPLESGQSCYRGSPYTRLGYEGSFDPDKNNLPLLPHWRIPAISSGSLSRA